MILESIIGTRTKLRILTCLTQYQDGLTRNRIAEVINLNHRNVYEQITDLEFFGIIKNENKQYSLNKNHYLYDAIDIFLPLGRFYENHIREQLYNKTFFHEKFNPHYYIGGYSAAIRFVTLYDYFVDLIHVGIERKYYTTAVKQLKVLNHLSDISVGKFVPGALNICLFPIDAIPSDIEYSNGCYYTSNTRGIIECFQHPAGLMEYGQVLLLLQSADEEVVDFTLLHDELKKNDFPLNLQYILALLSLNRSQHSIKEFSFDLKHEHLKKIESLLGPDLSSSYQHAVIEAIRTITGMEG